MRFEIKFLDMEKYPIDRFVDNLIELEECKQYHISISFLDHRKNSATILATGEFGEYMKSRFSRNKSLVFTLPDNYHNPFHVMTLEKDGYMICGCGYRESEQEHTKRTMIVAQKYQDSRTSHQNLEMKVISRNEILT